VVSDESRWPVIFADWRRKGPLRPELEDLLVPLMPVSALACRYDGPQFAPGRGLGGHPETMRRTRFGQVDEPELVQLVNHLNTARRGVMRCPPFTPWAVVLLRFHYPEGTDVEIVMGVAGCWNASNGARAPSCRDSSCLTSSPT
jgi:hypothetical protein